MAADETDFPLAMRGYDRGLVDDAIKDFRKEIINLTTLNTQLAAELREAQNRLIELENEMAEAASLVMPVLGLRQPRFSALPRNWLYA